MIPRTRTLLVVATIALSGTLLRLAWLYALWDLQLFLRTRPGCLVGHLFPVTRTSEICGFIGALWLMVGLVIAADGVRSKRRDTAVEGAAWLMGSVFLLLPFDQPLIDVLGLILRT